MLDKIKPPLQEINLATRFVQLLTGSSDPVMRLRFIHDYNRSQHPTSEREGTISQLWQDILEFQLQGYGVFYFMNECNIGPGSGKGGCAADGDIVDTCRVLATDHDHGLPSA